MNQKYHTYADPDEAYVHPETIGGAPDMFPAFDSRTSQSPTVAAQPAASVPAQEPSGIINGGVATSGGSGYAPGMNLSFQDTETQLGTAQQQAAAGETIAKDADKTKLTGKDIAGSAVKGIVSSGLTFFEGREKANLDDYENEMKLWYDSSKYWFDPLSDRPSMTFEEYKKSMPSQRDALMASTVTGGKMAKGTIALDPLGLGPMIAKKAGNDNLSGMLEYAYHKGGEGALSGIGKGGPVGAIVGGAVGYLQGLLGWNDAKKKDKAEAKKGREEYERQLSEWQKFRARRAELMDQQYQAIQLQAASDRAQQALDAKNANVKQKVIDKRALIAGLVRSAQTRIPTRVAERTGRA